MLLNSSKSVSFKAVICRGVNQEGKNKMYFFPDNVDCIINKYDKENYQIYNPKSSHPVQIVKRLIIDLIDKGSIVRFIDTSVNNNQPLIIAKIRNEVPIEDKIDILYKDGNSPIELNNDSKYSNDAKPRNAGLILNSKAKAYVEELGGNCFIESADNSFYRVDKNYGEVKVDDNSKAIIAENFNEVYAHKEAKLTVEKNRGMLAAKNNTDVVINENFSSVSLQDNSKSVITNNQQNGSIMISDNSTSTIKNNKHGSVVIPRHTNELDKRTVQIDSNYQSGSIIVGDNGITTQEKNNDEISIGINNGNIRLNAPGKISIDCIQALSNIIAQGKGAIIDVSKVHDTISDKLAFLKSSLTFLDGSQKGESLQKIFEQLNSKVKPRIFVKSKK